MKSLTAVLLLFLCGCNVAGFAAQALKGPEKVPAAYDLGLEPTLLVVENGQQPQVGEVIAAQLKGMISEELKRSAPTVVLVDPFNALSFGIVEERMTLRELGEAAGATRVIYVDLKSVRVAAITGTDSYIGRGEAEIKVHDVTTGQVVFPTTQSGGIAVNAQTDREPFKNQRPVEVQTRVLKELAGNIARVFHEYTIEED